MKASSDSKKSSDPSPSKKPEELDKKKIREMAKEEARSFGIERG
jgi:hypothetical protein